MKKVVGFALLVAMFPWCARADWEILSNCSLVENESNDGDSFHVECEGREYIFRLYFVDTPETSDRFPDRVAAQAAYWNVSEGSVLKAGEQAREFIQFKLRKNFGIYTQWEDARGASRLPRYYAFILTGDNEDLATLLVERGLARIYGREITTPEGTSSKYVQERLLDAQLFAKNQGLGLWGEEDDDTNIAAAMLTTEAKIFSCAKNLSVRSGKEPYQYIGYLTAGTEISVEKVLPSGVLIRAKLNNGDTRQCFCNRFELADAVPGVL